MTQKCGAIGRSALLRIVLTALLGSSLACRETHNAIDRTAIAQVDLAGIELAGVNGDSLDLSGRDLTGADLSGSRFRGADFTDSLLMNTDLSNAAVEGADFSGADLSGAILDNMCGIESANWTHAALDPKWATVVQLLTDGSVKDFSDYDLAHVCFSGRSYSGYSFTGADLREARFGGEANNLVNADFSRADLTGALMSAVDLRHAVFIDADLTNAELSNSDLRYADFSGATLTGARMHESDISGAVLTPGQLRDVGRSP